MEKNFYQNLALALEPVVRQAIKDIALKATDPGQEQPVSIQEAAQIVNKSVATLYYYSSRGLYPEGVCVKNGRRLYFYRSELLNWIKQGNGSQV
jgi:predicted DNA-binding transcriptional regulator AlpA